MGGIHGSLLHAVPVPLPVFRTPPLWPMDADPWYFLAKGQKVNIVGFVTHTISVADTQLCCCGTEAW